MFERIRRFFRPTSCTRQGPYIRVTEQKNDEDGQNHPDSNNRRNSNRHYVHTTNDNYKKLPEGGATQHRTSAEDLRRSKSAEDEEHKEGHHRRNKRDIWQGDEASSNSEIPPDRSRGIVPNYDFVTYKSLSDAQESVTTVVTIMRRLAVESVYQAFDQYNLEGSVISLQVSYGLEDTGNVSLHLGVMDKYDELELFQYKDVDIKDTARQTAVVYYKVTCPVDMSHIEGLHLAACLQGINLISTVSDPVGINVITSKLDPIQGAMLSKVCKHVSDKIKRTIQGSVMEHINAAKVNIERLIRVSSPSGVRIGHTREREASLGVSIVAGKHKKNRYNVMLDKLCDFENYISGFLLSEKTEAVENLSKKVLAKCTDLLVYGYVTLVVPGQESIDCLKEGFSGPIRAKDIRC